MDMDALLIFQTWIVMFLYNKISEIRPTNDSLLIERIFKFRAIFSTYYSSPGYLEEVWQRPLLKHFVKTLNFIVILKIIKHKFNKY